VTEAAVYSPFAIFTNSELVLDESVEAGLLLVGGGPDGGPDGACVEVCEVEDAVLVDVELLDVEDELLTPEEPEGGPLAPPGPCPFVD
jgi:hypothetical protein